MTGFQAGGRAGLVRRIANPGIDYKQAMLAHPLNRHRGKETVVFLLDHGIAFTSSTLQFFAIEHRDMAALIPDQPGLLQVASGLRDPFTTNAKHVGNQLLRHPQFFGVQSIQTQKEPSAQLLI